MKNHIFVSTEPVIDPSTGEVLFTKGDKLTPDQLVELSHVYGIIYVPVVVVTDYVEDHANWVVKNF